MNLDQLVAKGNSLRATEDRDGRWAYNACRISSLLLEEVIESGASADDVTEEVLPMLKDLAKMFQGIDPKNSFSRYVDGFSQNVNWRISELEKYVIKKKAKTDSPASSVVMDRT